MARRPRTFRRIILGSTAMVGLTAMACVVPSFPARGPGSRGGEPLDVEAVGVELVEAHNRVRAAHHLAPLVVNGSLEAAARGHARDMARREWMSHRSRDGSSPFRRMADQGYVFRRAGENVAAGYPSVEAVIRGWMRSPGHRRNIVGRFSQIGAACATAKSGTPYWCVTFGEPEAR
jgi:uncharacterized protein YkwD